MEVSCYLLCPAHMDTKNADPVLKHFRQERNFLHLTLHNKGQECFKNMITAHTLRGNCIGQKVAALF